MGGAYDSIPTTNGASPRQKQSVLLAAVYGLVASLMCAPVMMSLCQLRVVFAAPSNRIPATPSTRRGSLVHVYAQRVDHLRRPLLFRILSRVSKIGPLLVGRPSVVLREVEHDALRRRPGPGRRPYFSFKYG